MFIYFSIPVLIIIGLCFFFYLAGRYTAKKINSKNLEEEINKLRSVIEEKDKELQSQNKLTESTLKEYQEILTKSRKEFNKRSDEQREDVINTIRLKKRIYQLEAELRKNGIEVADVTFKQ